MAQAGSEEEFDAFVVQAWPRLRWTALMLTRDDHLAEDLAQTALVRTYAAWGRVRREDAFSYARKVLVNANIDRMRRRRVSEVHEPMEVAVESGGAVVEDRDALLRILDCLTLKERKHHPDLAAPTLAAPTLAAPTLAAPTLAAPTELH
jgi:DNA-directed RNA polymerase specialized sigma24 family protein